MKARLFLYILLIYFTTYKSNTAAAQSMAGLTGKADTSFSTYSAFISTQKKFPDITIVPETHSEFVQELKNIPYCSFSNRVLKTDVFYSVSEKRIDRPAILIIHGGGWRSGNRSQHYPLAERLAAAGYVCFTPEYRLSTEALFPAAVYDIKAAIRWVRKNAMQYHIDTAKIVVLGFSAGGELAAFMGTTPNMPLFEGTACDTDMRSNVNAVIDIDGTLSFVHPDSREGDDSKRISAATNWFGYTKKENIELWEAASPLSYVNGNTAPTLFINSAVAAMHAGREDYIKILTEHHIYTEVKEFEGAPHAFCLFDPWFEPTVKCILSFLKKVFP